MSVCGCATDIAKAGKRRRDSSHRLRSIIPNSLPHSDEILKKRYCCSYKRARPAPPAQANFLASHRCSSGCHPDRTLSNAKGEWRDLLLEIPCRQETSDTT